MPERAQRSAPARALGQCHKASWSGPRQRPSVLGLVVAAFVGGTAALSWSLSTWIAFSQAAVQPREAPASFEAQAAIEATAETAAPLVALLDPRTPRPAADTDR